jgi:hypothetical protein
MVVGGGGGPPSLWKGVQMFSEYLRERMSPKFTFKQNKTFEERQAESRSVKAWPDFMGDLEGVQRLTY